MEKKRTEEDKAASIAETSLVLQAIELIREDSKGKRGVAGKVKCPKCSGELGYSVARSNGHVWGRCSTPDCLAWMM